MNNNKSIFIPAIILSLFIQQWLSIKPYEEMKAEQIIKTFIESNELTFTSTEEYDHFLREIFWGNFPELVTLDSGYITKPEEVDYVIDYVWKYSGYKNIYEISNSIDDLEEAIPSQKQTDLLDLLFQSSSPFGRLNAISYAYQWSESGGTKRNPIYPDFGSDDCTNFISQTMLAGGFLEKGSGDGCKHEETNIEWYVEPNPTPSIFCLGDFRYWEWSTSWSVPDPLRMYFAYENNYAISHGWTTSASTAKYFLSPGDVIQLQYDDNGIWTGYHTMIITDEDTNDLYVTYHSNAGGLDEVDKPLSSITLLDGRRFVLVEIIFPWQITLPLIYNSGDSQIETENYLYSYPAPESQKDVLNFNPYPAP